MPAILVLSHSNYIKNYAGTEKYILEQIQHFSRQGYGSFHFFPSKNYSFLSRRKSVYGVHEDKRFAGYHRVQHLLRTIARHGSNLRVAYVHHLMFWQQADYLEVGSLLRKLGIPQVFFLHDFYTCCPGAFIPCYAEHQRVCNASPVRCGLLTDCLQKTYENQLRKWRNGFREVLALADEIVAPSEFLRDVFGTIFPFYQAKMVVRGHLRLLPRESEARPSTQCRKPRIAYLGYHAEHKGWNIWEKLVSDRQFQRRYEFYHLGGRKQRLDGVINVPYSYHDGGPMAAVHVLEKHNIDLVFLWSMVPESYSYTYHEAIAAGLPVLTSQRSGNIASCIQRSPQNRGLVFQDDSELIDFLGNDAAVHALVRIPREKYVLEPDPYLWPLRSAAA